MSSGSQDDGRFRVPCHHCCLLPAAPPGLSEFPFGGATVLGRPEAAAAANLWIFLSGRSRQRANRCCGPWGRTGVRTMWTRSVVPFARKYSLGLSSKYERGHAEDMVPCKEFFGAAMVSFSAR